jgi:hypothetical protein
LHLDRRFQEEEADVERDEEAREEGEEEVELIMEVSLISTSIFHR